MLIHRILILVSCFLAGIQVIQAALDSKQSTPSMKVHQTGAEKLVVYTDVPGHETKFYNVDPRAKSPIYEIRVRSQATDMQWVRCFANYTYNRGVELPHVNVNGGGRTNPNVRQGYQVHTGGWSHTYANIEMSETSTVQVEIRKIGTTLLDGSPVIEKFAVHPAHKVSDQEIADGIVRFKLNKPCQVVIDINGQMDDHNAAYPELKQVGPVHAVSLFANPIMGKPPTSGPGIRYVKSGSTPDSTPDTASDYTTMVFGPGVHSLGANFKVYAQHSYYLPGDAILYGSLSNHGTPKTGRSSGDRITLYGYGTLNGFFIPHYQFNDNNPAYPAGSDSGAALNLDNVMDLTVNGITVADSANFSGFILPHFGSINRIKDHSKIIWTKAISWRTNGDGFSGGYLLEDCFLRTGDDSTALAGDRRRLTVWKDSNANMFRLRNFSPATTRIVEDCDVIYHRLRSDNGFNGSVFPIENVEHNKHLDQVVPINVTIRNIRFHDKMSNMPVFKLDSTDKGGRMSYTGLKFQNISCYLPASPKVRNKLKGTAVSPWNDSPVFDNVTFDHQDGKPPVKLTKENFNRYFDSNQYVNPGFLP